MTLWSLFNLGEIAELHQRGTELLQEAHEKGDLFAAANYGAYVIPISYVATGNLAEGERHLREHVKTWSQQGYHVQHLAALQARVQIDLFRFDAPAAWNHLQQEWRDFRLSLLNRLQEERIVMLHLRARCAVAMARKSTGMKRAKFIGIADADAKRLFREHMPWATPLAQLVCATTACLRGDHTTAVELLRSAAVGFDLVDMNLYAAATRRRIGQLLAGDEGTRLIGAADAWMRGQNINDPASMTEMHAPGF
jgi:hypothetical protein